MVQIRCTLHLFDDGSQGISKFQLFSFLFNNNGNRATRRRPVVFKELRKRSVAKKLEKYIEKAKKV